MTARTVLREIRQFPATALFSLTWVAVFATMAILWHREDPTRDWWGLLVRGIGDGQRFGDLSLALLRQGQVWRLVTCNFVHFSLLHLGVNLFAFYLLGSLVESWYGSSLFTAIYLVAGGVGNTLAMLARASTGSNPLNQSGGGSVVIMALIGLCAMVGWRSRTSMGSDLGWQMVKAVVMTGLLGLAFSRYIDNLGHLGGVLVGLVIGLMHRVLIRLYGRPFAWILGQVALVLILACGVAQYVTNHRQGSRYRDAREELLRRAFEEANMTLGVVALLGEPDEGRKNAVRAFETASPILDSSGGRAAFRRGITLALAASKRPLGDEERTEYNHCLGMITGHVLSLFEPVFRLGPDPAAVDRLKTLATAAQSRTLSDEEREEFRRTIATEKDFVSKQLAERVRRYWRQQDEEARARARLR